MALNSINPATGEVIATFEPHDAAEVERRLQASSDAFRRHRRSSFAERAQRMLRAAEILDDEKERIGRLMTLEMGKPLTAACAEASKCALACRYYAEQAERALADEVIATNASKSFVRYQPLGPVIATMPWSFPFWQVFCFAAPALMAGNVGLLKHASQRSPVCSGARRDFRTSRDAVPCTRHR